MSFYLIIITMVDVLLLLASISFIKKKICVTFNKKMKKMLRRIWLWHILSNSFNRSTWYYQNPFITDMYKHTFT
ncbi:MAG: hypothetical protein K0S67_504 [Nitrososphaeraceae archaeon]|jgi:hypothetical protein|nr:hypothetical protein [Nitrososphaeraceae archaeon]MCD6036620.1 hypothetical protein [Nitrososphaeraceae archaeon]